MISVEEGQRIIDICLAQRLVPTVLKCGLGLMQPGGKLILKVSTEPPNKHRPYLVLLEELYNLAIERKIINP